MPFTQGTLCTKVARYLDRTYSKDRVLHPMKRVGAKGEGRFERISWDEALDTIAAKFKEIAAVEPQSILPCSYAGTMGLVQYASMDRRFFHKLGASLLERTLCSSAGKVGMKITLGAGVGMDPERFDEAKLILIWGSNPIVSNLHLWSRVQEAKRRGAKVIAIDPYRSLTAEKCDQHLAPLPGTDAALALGMMHVIIGEGLLTMTITSGAIRSALRSCASGCRTIRRKRPRPSAVSRETRSWRWRASTRRRGRRRSGSITACSGTPAAAWRCAPSPVCRRSPGTGAMPRGACRCPPAIATA